MPRCVSPTDHAPIDDAPTGDPTGDAAGDATGGAAVGDATFTALLQHSMPALRRFLVRLCGRDADADDVLQETMAKVWRHRAGYDPAQNGEAWLLQAAFRCFCDQRRRQRGAPAAAADPEPLPAPPAPCTIELRDELRFRLQHLDPLAQALLVGFHGEGRSLKELAARHGLPLNTVKSHLHRARLRLHETTGSEPRGTVRGRSR